MQIKRFSIFTAYTHMVSWEWGPINAPENNRWYQM